MSFGDAAIAGSGIAASAVRTIVFGESEAIFTREGIETIATEWSALEERVKSVTLFQSLGWARAVFEFEAKRDPDFAPVVATLRQHGRLVAVLPLQRIRSRFRSALTPLGGAFGQYAEMLAEPGIDAEAALREMLLAALRIRPVDMVSFLKVRADSTLATALPDGALRTGRDEAAPFVELGGFPDFAAYFQTIKPKTRKNMRNARNRLERDGTLTHHVAATREEKLGVIARTLAGRAGRLRDQGLTSRAFTDPSFAEFCASLAERQDIELLAMSLRHNGQPIAEQWGFVHKGRYYAYVASRDFEASDESPGKLHLREVIETCAERGVHTADLLVPSMPYKLTWATGVTPVLDYAVPVTLKGRLGVVIWDRWLRPLAKRVVLGLPKGLRAALMKAAGRA